LPTNVTGALIVEQQIHGETLLAVARQMLKMGLFFFWQHQLLRVVVHARQRRVVRVGLIEQVDEWLAVQVVISMVCSSSS
jgi:glycerol-3-phosphate O-acyltransferase